MTRLAAGLALLALGLGGIGLAHAKPKRPPMQFASPAAIVATDVALSQLAQRKGQAVAMRETAAEGAVLFTPQPVIARDWLKSAREPVSAASRQTHQVWLSCDGSLAVSYGARTQPDGSAGYYTTVWQSQPKGGYKWVMDQGDAVATPLIAPEMIGSSVSTCNRGARPSASGVVTSAPTQFPAGTHGGWSEDRTLRWDVTVENDCSRTVTVSLVRGPEKRLEQALQKHVSGAPLARCNPA